MRQRNMRAKKTRLFEEMSEQGLRN